MRWISFSKIWKKVGKINFFAGKTPKNTGKVHHWAGKNLFFDGKVHFFVGKTSVLEVFGFLNFPMNLPKIFLFLLNFNKTFVNKYLPCFLVICNSFLFQYIAQIYKIWFISQIIHHRTEFEDRRETQVALF